MQGLKSQEDSQLSRTAAGSQAGYPKKLQIALDAYMLAN